jgi:hypothetical protein
MMLVLLVLGTTSHYLYHTTPLPSSLTLRAINSQEEGFFLQDYVVVVLCSSYILLVLTSPGQHLKQGTGPPTMNNAVLDQHTKQDFFIASSVQGCCCCCLLDH